MELATRPAVCRQSSFRRGGNRGDKVPLGPAELIAFTTVKYTNEGLRERVDQWQFLRLQ